MARSESVILSGRRMDGTLCALNVITASRSDDWSRGLSPFYVGPVDLYGNYRSINVENAWQYSKVYEYYLEEDGSVGERYFKWAQDGWNSMRAQRYPMGKGAKPLFLFWPNEQQQVYKCLIFSQSLFTSPCNSQAVHKNFCQEIRLTKKRCMHEAGETLYLWDFDGLPRSHTCIVLRGRDNGEQEFLVLDGKQRLSAVFDFIEDKFRITLSFGDKTISLSYSEIIQKAKDKKYEFYAQLQKYYTALRNYNCTSRHNPNNSWHGHPLLDK